MAVYKDKKTNTWRVVYRFTDWTGQPKQTTKRGFATRREALQWESEMMNRKQGDLNMTFASFVQLYIEDVRPRLKENTWHTKEHIIRTKLMPYFGQRRISEISSHDVIRWQNEMINHRDNRGKPFSPVYLKTLHNSFSSIMNHAVRHYGLRENPAAKVGNMGKAKNREMLFWTREEYELFAEAIMDRSVAYYAFEMLYWCGIREGEMLALTPSDFDFEKGTVTISKSYQRLGGRDLITTPKTAKSNRTVTLPANVRDEMQFYISTLYAIEPDERIFPISKQMLQRAMELGAKAAGVKRIRIHDIRHSHISLLIDMGFPPTAIADRVGHETIDITCNYAHMFPTRQTEMALQLDQMRAGKEVADEYKEP